MSLWQNSVLSGNTLLTLLGGTFDVQHWKIHFLVWLNVRSFRIPRRKYDMLRLNAWLETSLRTWDSTRGSGVVSSLNLDVLDFWHFSMDALDSQGLLEVLFLKLSSFQTRTNEKRNRFWLNTKDIHHWFLVKWSF